MKNYKHLILLLKLIVYIKSLITVSKEYNIHFNAFIFNKAYTLHKNNWNIFYLHISEYIYIYIYIVFKITKSYIHRIQASHFHIEENENENNNKANIFNQKCGI